MKIPSQPDGRAGTPPKFDSHLISVRKYRMELHGIEVLRVIMRCALLLNTLRSSEKFGRGILGLGRG